MSLLQERISEKVWDIKYRYRYQNTIVDHSIEDTWRRVARAIAKSETVSERKMWEKNFYAALENFSFLPGGRILAGAGTKHAVTLFNCFVMPVSDSLPGIFDGLKEGALTLQQGGGIGYDFSTLRPSGYPTHHTGSVASGPVSFMRIWNAMCSTMLSTGARRGAMMGILRCDHPDIEEFILAKSDPKDLRHFNVSVLVTNEFMKAVKDNRDWELVFPTEQAGKNTVRRRWSGSSSVVECEVVSRLSARHLWNKIITSAYNYAEPGVIFEDTINRQNNLWYKEWISATNPCGEIPLPAYGACNLGAINLAQCVIHPFAKNAAINWTKLEELTAIATRFLDNVIDVSRYPIKPQKTQAFQTRRIGVGITGLADFFLMLNIRYGSQESQQLSDKLMKRICEVTWITSAELAKERGNFPSFNRKKYLQGNFVKHLPIAIRRLIEKNGMRNSHHNTIAPTGTISLLANNVSNGIEPYFSAHYERTVRTAEGSLEKFNVAHYGLRLWEKEFSSKSMPPAWIDSHQLKPEDHLNIQAAFQPYVDNAISKTINLPENFPLKKLTEIYTRAFELGLKGCTIYRPNPITGSVLKLQPEEDNTDRCCQV